MLFFIERRSGVTNSADNGSFISDLKTVRGVKNRILNGAYLVGEWTIYRCTDTGRGISYVKVGIVTKS